MTQAGRVTLEVTRDSANGPAYLTIKWLDSNGAQIKNPTNYNMANKYNAYTDLEAGTYYIEIAKYSTHTGDYALRADFASAGNNEVEPNNNRETAQTITSGQTVRGFISEQDLTDFYKIVLTQAGRLTLEVTRDSTIGPSQLTIRWLDSDGAQIKTANPNLASKYSVYTDLEAGTYYFEIAKSGANTGVYNLQVSFASAGNNEVEPNNNRETAQTITSGQTVRGLISYQDATDFYKIVLPQAGRVTLEVTRDSTIGPSHLTIRWLDSAGAQIKTANPNLASKYGVYTDLEAGTYYFEIAKYNGNTGVYNLGVSISGT
ncbi:MAG: pre-peptidase C-terminal domain-containing protein [Nitrososphaerota archaeon]|nr:pre-peptidase C-terminal domain-containing protein [Nitrososphaerota archaeon]